MISAESIRITEVMHIACTTACCAAIKCACADLFLVLPTASSASTS